MRKRISIVFIGVLLINLFSIAIPSKAQQADLFNEPVKIRCTCYIDSGTTASGAQTRYGIMAAKREWMGCVAEVNAINEDGSVGEFIGFFEILDTGYGIETGVGESQILKGRTKGTIETGDSVDIYMPTMHQAEEWIDKYGDYVYIKLIKGNG